MAGYRAARLSQRIHQEVSMLFGREVSDPRLQNVNVTRVELSGDLRYAKIFVAPILGDAVATRAPSGSKTTRETSAIFSAGISGCRPILEKAQ